MPQKYSVLIIDDHPITSNSYKRACEIVELEDENYQFDVDIVIDCDSAVKKIKDAAKLKKRIDIVFLDIKLPPSSDGKFLSGEDIGLLIKELLPNSKIVISTTYNDNYRVDSLIKSLNPDGFLVKNDIIPEELIAAIKRVIEDPPHYSSSVMTIVRRQLSNPYILDQTDRKLLYELSIGTKMSTLENVLMLSKRGLYRRKENIKEIFGIKGKDDRDLVLMAQDKGFI